MSADKINCCKDRLLKIIKEIDEINASKSLSPQEKTDQLLSIRKTIAGIRKEMDDLKVPQIKDKYSIN